MINKLEKYRKEIDITDKKIVELLNKRAKAALEIGKIKKVSSSNIYAPAREKQVLDNVINNNNGPLCNKDIKKIYTEIMSSCRALERKLKVAYLGPKATFTHQAAIKSFGSDIDFISCKMLSDVIDEVETGRANFAVVPVENSTEGSVNATLDKLVNTDLKVVNEINMKISHFLVSKSKIENVKVIYSHQQALAQCNHWIKNNLPNVEIFPVSSTAQAAKLAMANKNSAAITSEMASQMYGLNIIASNIQDTKANRTRFFILGNSGTKKTGKDKTSIVFTIKDKVNVLYNILSIFSKNKINLTKIESRPTKKVIWQYIFFIDFDGHIDDKKIANAIKEIKQHCVFLKVLGSYPKAE